MIFEVKCDKRRTKDEGLTDRTDAMIVPFIYLDCKHETMRHNK